MSTTNITVDCTFATAEQSAALFKALTEYRYRRLATRRFRRPEAELRQLDTEPETFEGWLAETEIDWAWPESERQLRFGLWGGPLHTGDTWASLYAWLQRLTPPPVQIVAVTVADNVDGLSVEVFDGGHAWSYETGMGGDADEPLEQALFDDDGDVLDTAMTLLTEGRLTPLQP
ncbi:hypothetical protein [Arhodomonas sp. AD133]|uniref:hypothetical protein n=1 Tax=Arhodomonas sp. AD133 TaxID=3415009 RepID=UPI003EBA9643